jgi:hypothetical protein
MKVNNTSPPKIAEFTYSARTVGYKITVSNLVSEVRPGTH